MSLGLWILSYLAYSLLMKWIISWGGAKKICGWSANIFMGFSQNAEELNPEQIRFMALFLWVVATIFFIVGLLKPEFRISFLKFLNFVR